mmetsp:Transcript_2329/g.4888  ORF Transcript_2329/g.4888 Transcript_2329/m.4888 type:complete len:314 (-) Transcript_2329:342-1283(-)
MEFLDVSFLGIGNDQGLDNHLVGCESTRLVGTNDRAATQCFHGWQLANNSIALDHLLSTQRQTQGDDGRKPLRNSRYSQRYGNLEVIDATLEDTTKDGIEKLVVIHDPHQYTNSGNDLCEQIPKLIEFLVQGGLFGVFRRLRDSRLNLSDFRHHSRSGNDSDCLSSANGCPRKDHVLLVGNLFPANNGVAGLEDRLGFSRQGALVAAQSSGDELAETNVRRSFVSHTNLDNVSGNQFFGGQVIVPNSVAQAGCVQGLHLFEGLQGIFGIGFLPDSYNGVDDENQQNDGRFHKGFHPVVDLFEKGQYKRKQSGK